MKNCIWHKPFARCFRPARPIPERLLMNNRTTAPTRTTTRPIPPSPRSRPSLRFDYEDEDESKKTFSPSLLKKMDAYWRAANYLSVGQIYLYDNPLLKKPLKR